MRDLVYNIVVYYLTTRDVLYIQRLITNSNISCMVEDEGDWLMVHLTTFDINDSQYILNIMEKYGSRVQDLTS